MEKVWGFYNLYNTFYTQYNLASIYYFRDMTDSYRAEIARMAGRKADVAFLPVDPRLEDWFYLGADDYLQKVDAHLIFPMHFWGDFSVCQKLIDHSCSESYQDRIITISEKGQNFSI